MNTVLFDNKSYISIMYDTMIYNCFLFTAPTLTIWQNFINVFPWSQWACFWKFLQHWSHDKFMIIILWIFLKFDFFPGFKEWIRYVHAVKTPNRLAFTLFPITMSPLRIQVCSGRNNGQTIVSHFFEYWTFCSLLIAITLKE